MRWKRASNFIIAAILSFAYAIVTLLNIIGPLHTNAAGVINPVGALAVFSGVYFLFSLVITWGVYFYFRKKPEFLFFTLIILGIVIIILENNLWAYWGS